MKVRRIGIVVVRSVQMQEKTSGNRLFVQRLFEFERLAGSN